MAGMAIATTDPRTGRVLRTFDDLTPAELEDRLAREGRTALAAACFGFLATRARLDLAGWGEDDIFAH